MSRLACIIPFFDGRDTIARALDSVLARTECGELILVSDGSTQPVSQALLPRHLEARASGRLRLVEVRDNLGQAAARNLGASQTTAEFLCFLDQDDEVLEGFHAKALELLESRPECAAVEIGAEIISGGRPILEASDPRYRLLLASVPWNLVVRRTAFWDCGGFPVGEVFRTEVAGEDIAFRSALNACFHVMSLSLRGVRHDVRPGSATDRFIGRTELTDAGLRFLSRHPVEEDGSLQRAIDAHVAAATRASRGSARLRRKTANW